MFAPNTEVGCKSACRFIYALLRSHLMTTGADLL